MMKFKSLPDGKVIYETVDGDMVDLIAFSFYGDHQGTTELLYDANPGLADRGMVLPAGVVISMPERVAVPIRHEQVNLWD